VDVEDVRAPVDALGLATRYFAATEAQGLRRLSPADQLMRFYALWTLKEAYVKARGRGLRLPLDRCAFELQSGSIRLMDEPPSANDPAHRWHFHLLRADSAHLAAICVAAARSPHSLHAHRLVSLTHDEPLILETLGSG
jgi:4'-phosphopantetheinyl transferase